MHVLLKMGGVPKGATYFRGPHVSQSVTGEGRTQPVQNSVTYFMDGP